MIRQVRPLVAVIENSEERALQGKPPEITVLKPMGPIRAWFYRHFKSRHKADDYGKSIHRTCTPEYVVEISPALFARLVGGGRIQGKPDKLLDSIHLVFTPSQYIKATSAISLGGDARP